MVWPTEVPTLPALVAQQHKERPRLLLRNGLAEPVLEARWAEAGIISRDEALIVNLCAVVERTDVRNHLAWVAFCTQETPDQFIHSDRFGTGYLDPIVKGFGVWEIGQGGSHIIRPDGLHESGW